MKMPYLEYYYCPHRNQCEKNGCKCKSNDKGDHKISMDTLNNLFPIQEIDLDEFSKIERR